MVGFVRGPNILAKSKPCLLRRMPSGDCPAHSNRHDARMIHVQRGSGGPADCCPTDDLPKVLAPAKMALPPIESWVEEPHLTPGHDVFRRSPVAFEIIAVRTGEAEVLGFRQTARCSRNDVIKLERFGTKILAKAAVFAEELGSRGHEVAQPGRNGS